MKTKDEILRKYEDEYEYHFHEGDRKWIFKAMEEYANQYFIEKFDNIYIVEEMHKALRDIAEGLYPSTAEEAFIFVDTAKKIANDVLNKIKI